MMLWHSVVWKWIYTSLTFCILSICQVMASEVDGNFQELFRTVGSRPVPNTIPKIVHFIYGLRSPDPELLLPHYLSVRSAYLAIKPDIIYFWYHYMPKGSHAKVKKMTIYISIHVLTVTIFCCVLKFKPMRVVCFG